MVYRTEGFVARQRLAPAYGGLLDAADRLAKAADAAKKLGRPDAVGRLADLTEELMRAGRMGGCRAGRRP